MLGSWLSHTRGLYPSQYEGTIVGRPDRTLRKHKYSNPYKVPGSTQQILSTILLLLLISPWGNCNLKIVLTFKGEERFIFQVVPSLLPFLQSFIYDSVSSPCRENILCTASSCASACGIRASHGPYYLSMFIMLTERGSNCSTYFPRCKRPLDCQY